MAKPIDVVGKQPGKSAAKRSQLVSTALADKVWERSRDSTPEIAPALAAYFPQFLKESGRALPWRRTNNAYKILVAELMLQKTHSRAVGAVWSTFLTRWPTPRGLAPANPAELSAVMKPLGIHYRAERIQAIVHELAVRFSYRVPNKYDELRSLPGVGDYIACSVLCQAYSQQRPMIDVNAGRVYARLYGQVFQTERQKLRFARNAAEAVIALAPAREINLGVFDFAHAVCRPVPKCDECSLRHVCRYAAEGQRRKTSTLSKPKLLD